MNNNKIAEFMRKADSQESEGNWVGAINFRAEAVAEVTNKAAIMPAPQEPDQSNVLEKIAETHKPTKRHHDYLKHYWRHFRDRRISAKKVLEIGVQTPRSVKMWEEFFPNAIIHGIDIDENCSAFENGRVQMHIGDQTNEFFLTKFLQKTGGDFDVIIDDGMHTSYSILKSFSYLYPALTTHGIYAIEDIIRQPEILNFLQYLINCVNYVPDEFDLAEWMGLSSFDPNLPWLLHNTISVACYRYIAFVERGFNPRDNRFLMPLEEFRAEKDRQMDETVRQMTSKNIPINRETLLNHLHKNNHSYVDRLLDRLRNQTRN